MKKILAFCIVSAIAIAVVSKACAQAAAAFSTGTFNSDAILSLAGPVSNELYGITWAATTTTGNGYLFTHYNSTTLTYGNGGSDGVFFPSPNTTGDSGFDTILKSAADQGVTGSPNFTLNGLTAGIIYNVLILDADDRTSIGGPRSITVSDGLGHSIAGSNWRDGSGNAVIYGSYILATFTASGATEAFTITGSGGPQVNDVLVIIHGTGPPPPPTNVVAQQSNNGQVSLSWTASVGATSYNVERSTSTGSPYVVIATNLATLTYTDSTAVIGTFYFYAITANNAYATSAAAPAVFGWRVVIPTLNTNELVVTATTPQDYGAVGDGITDDSAAFQAAINAVYNSGGRGGGVVYVPAGTYAFYTNINLLTGVTLHGDWQDWTKGTNGLVGTTFKVYQGAGSTNGSAFLNVQSSASLWGVNIWYPNQDPNNITQYPFSIRLGSDSVLRNIVLVNPYLGVQVQGETKWILSTLIGSPLSLGFVADNCADVCQSEDVRFSPAVWPASKLPGAPAANGPPATWMRTNATAMRLLRLDGMGNMKTEISGFKSGIEFDASVNGSASSCFYEGHVTNCGIALNLTDAQQSAIPQFANFTLAGDVAISHTNTASDVNVQFKDCNITGYSGVAVQVAGNSWQSAMDFMNCNITGTLLANGPGIVNMISCTLNASTQCVMNATVTRTAFTGCTFNPATNIVNNGAATNLVMESRPANGSPLPMVSWTNIINDANSRRPAKVALFLATSYGANGTDSSDDTAAIQNALDAAGSNGGGIVYVPAGKYQLNGGLNVPSGVELRGAYELRHRTWPGQDGKAKGTILQPYSGQGGTNGTPAIVLQPNAGVRGMTITYESQTPYCIQFPPAIQGRGSNVYAIGVQSPNAYWFVDLNTYTCSNHFLFMLDGSFMWRGFTVGNGSSGTVLDCHNNQTYWWDNYDSASDLSNMTSSDTNAGPAYTAFVRGNGQYYDFGNCTEQLIKTFSYQQNIWLHCSSQNGVGANVTGIAAIFDAAYEGFVFEVAGPSTVNMVNMEWMVEVNSGVSGLNSPMAVDSRADYQGTVRIFNSPLHAQPNCGYLLNGGDIGFELVHGWQYANTNININGGVLHMIGAGFFGSNPNITFGANAGIAGRPMNLLAATVRAGLPTPISTRTTRSMLGRITRSSIQTSSAARPPSMPPARIILQLNRRPWHLMATPAPSGLTPIRATQAGCDITLAGRQRSSSSIIFPAPMTCLGAIQKAGSFKVRTTDTVGRHWTRAPGKLSLLDSRPSNTR